MYGGGVLPRWVPGSQRRGDRSRLGKPKVLTCGGMIRGSGRGFLRFFNAVEHAGPGFRKTPSPLAAPCAEESPLDWPSLWVLEDVLPLLCAPDAPARLG